LAVYRPGKSEYPQRVLHLPRVTGGATRIGESSAWTVQIDAATRYRVLIGAGWTLVGIGCVLRILQYVANRSLSIDESFLALNLIEKSPQRLLHALDFNQAAPLGFLEAQKLAITLFGSSEYALRLLPLLVSLLSLVLFYAVVKRLLRPLSATLAVAVFSLLDPLVYYSATAKQYTFDVTGTTLVLGAALMIESRPLRRSDLLVLGPLGAILVWFSHASVFGLAGVGVLLVLGWIRSRNWTLAPALVAVLALWAGSLAAEYVLSRSNLGRILGAFQRGGGAAFLPLGSGHGWFENTIDRLRYVVGLEDAASGQPILGSLPSGVSRSLAVLIVIVGAVGFVSLLFRRPRLALVLVVPPLLAGIAAVVHEYPLVGRTMLFALPSVALCIGEGVAVFLAATAPKALLAAVAVACVGAIAVLPAIHAVHPRTNEEMKQALRYLGKWHRRGDALYVSAGAQYALAYYHLCGCSAFDPETVWRFSTIARRGFTGAIEPRTANLVVDSGRGTAETKPLLGRSRVWILFAESRDGKISLIDYLSKHGNSIQSFRASGPPAIAASLFLYNLKSSSAR
jgi:4-amino-4-deoxy-L-arabinose transferase-like glycosyltransferase